MGNYHSLCGAIGACGFSSGNRVVIGHWDDSPIGPFGDVMWAEPDDHRTLIASSSSAATFITTVYEFDSVIVEKDLAINRSATRLTVRWPNGSLEAGLGRAVPFPPRPDWITERIERSVGRATMGVETYGTSPTGVEELYRADRVQRIRTGWAVVAGQDLGSIGPPRPASKFGFSEPPPFASVTHVRPRLLDPSGRLDEVISRLNSALD